LERFAQKVNDQTHGNGASQHHGEQASAHQHGVFGATGHPSNTTPDPRALSHPVNDPCHSMSCSIFYSQDTKSA
jgi:hypothetical protein